MTKAQTVTSPTKKPAAKPIGQAKPIDSAPKKATKSQNKRATELFGPPAPEAGIPEHLSDTPKQGRRVTDAMSFAVQQLSAPVAPQLQTPTTATEEFNRELAALKQKYGITNNKLPKAPRAERLVQNGITRPDANTLCGKIWAAADELSENSHGVATIAALKKHEATHDINEHTIKTQYARWRSFNGISGRLPKIHAVHEERAIWNSPSATPTN